MRNSLSLAAPGAWLACGTRCSVPGRRYAGERGSRLSGARRACVLSRRTCCTSSSRACAQQTNHESSTPNRALGFLPKTRSQRCRRWREGTCLQLVLLLLERLQVLFGATVLSRLLHDVLQLGAHERCLPTNPSKPGGSTPTPTWPRGREGELADISGSKGTARLGATRFSFGPAVCRVVWCAAWPFRNRGACHVSGNPAGSSACVSRSSICVAETSTRMNLDVSFRPPSGFGRHVRRNGVSARAFFELLHL